MIRWEEGSAGAVFTSSPSLYQSIIGSGSPAAYSGEEQLLNLIFISRLLVTLNYFIKLGNKISEAIKTLTVWLSFQYKDDVWFRTQSLFDLTASRSTIVVLAIFMSSRAKFQVPLWQTFNIKGAEVDGNVWSDECFEEMIGLVLKCTSEKREEWNKRFVITNLVQKRKTNV